MKHRIFWSCDNCRKSGHADVGLPMAFIWIEDAIVGSHRQASPTIRCPNGLRITKIEPTTDDNTVPVT